MKKIKSLFTSNYKHYICISITIIFLCFAFFYFKYADKRILESFKDLYTSFIFYLNELFEFKIPGEVTINNYSSVPFEKILNFPDSFEEFKDFLKSYFDLFFNSKNFLNYFREVILTLYNFSKYILLFLPLILLLVLVTNNNSNINNNYNKDSKALIIFKKIENKIFLPIKKWIKNFIEFLKENDNYLKIWLLIWFYNFNFIAIIIEVLAYYLYFVASFKFTTLYIQFIKLIKDLSVVINFIPFIIWIIIILVIFHLYRLNKGYKNLNHFECKNKGFINERPLVLMLCGTMGSKKTTMMTDIALSKEAFFRFKALELLMKNDMKFPFFPWINLENSLKQAIKNHSVYNLATVKRFIYSKKKKFLKHQTKINIFEYEYEKYGYYYDDGLDTVDVWKVLESYSQLYFIYVIESSLIMSNYSIRSDNDLTTLGNFPMWNCDFFKKHPFYEDRLNHYSHIIDFDMLRLGKKLIAENKKSNIFEFGIICVTEIGKERGNTVELSEVKKNVSETNQKNDLFNDWLKMVRHGSTIDGFCFCLFITDDQRPTSWGADARDLCQIIKVNKCSEIKLAMPFFELEYMIIDFLFEKFKNKYLSHRYERGDNTLFIYLLKKIINPLYQYKEKITNTFGFFDMKLNVEEGNLEDNHPLECRYFLMKKKIYAKRFATDAFNEFFIKKALTSDIGFDELESFTTVKANFEEMLKENSYFFNRIIELQNTFENKEKRTNSENFVY